MEVKCQNLAQYTLALITAILSFLVTLLKGNCIVKGKVPKRKTNTSGMVALSTKDKLGSYSRGSLGFLCGAVYWERARPTLTVLSYSALSFPPGKSLPPS